MRVARTGQRLQLGFTIVELIVILVLLGVLSAVALPHLIGNNDNAVQIFGDRLVSGLRLAQKSALARRRLVCATVTPSSLLIRIALTNPPPVGIPCSAQLANAPDSEFASPSSAVAASGMTGTYYIQPNGDITSDFAGKTPVKGEIVVSAAGSASRTIQVEGSTGYVE